jgi:hypothetical protein
MTRTAVPPLQGERLTGTGQTCHDAPHAPRVAASDARNDHGLPERTLQEVRLFELGPCTFPAYADATAGVRSLTDWYRRLAAAVPVQDRPP